jgi:hypothetical protein
MRYWRKPYASANQRRWQTGPKGANLPSSAVIQILHEGSNPPAFPDVPGLSFRSVSSLHG